MNAIERLENRWHFNEMQDDRLVWSKDLTGRNAENQRIADLASRSSHCNTNRRYHEHVTFRKKKSSIHKAAAHASDCSRKAAQISKQWAGRQTEHSIRECAAVSGIAKQTYQLSGRRDCGLNGAFWLNKV